MAWYRIWIRPLVPDIDAIPEEDRKYYESHLLATPHNPNRIDLNMDILFELGGPELARRIADRIDANALPPLVSLLERLENVDEFGPGEGDLRVFVDLRDRLRGLKCWYTTQRNVQAWIAGVHGFLRSRTDRERDQHRDYLDRMMDSEIESTKALIMVVSELGESTHMYGNNFAEHLERKLDLMDRYRSLPPRIDPNFIWRVPGIDFYDMEEVGLGVSPVSGQLDDA